MALAQPAGQQRNAFERDWGNFATVAAMPNGSGNALPSASVPFNLEAGDTCYLTLSTGQCQYLCISAGTSGGGDAVWVPSSGQGPWSSVLYVDNVRGSDTTGQRGNANRPFATIQAALNAMSTGDTVETAPQVFTITSALTVPASVVNGTCAGAVAAFTPSLTQPLGGTVISFLAGTTWNLGANLGLSGFVLANLGFAATTCVSADGSAYAQNTYGINGIYVINCNFITAVTNAVTTKYLRTFEMAQSKVGGGILSHVSGANVLYREVAGAVAANSPSMTISYDGTDALATTTVQTVTIQQSVIGGVGTSAFVTLGGQCHLVVDSMSTIGGLKGSALAVSGAKVPSLVCSGYIGGANASTLDFASAGAEWPDTATALTIDFRGARFYGNNGSGTGGPTTIKFKIGGAAANFQTVKLDDTETLPGCTITADAAIHITGRGADWPSVVLTTPGANGDIIPPSISGTIDISAGGAVAKTWVNLGYAGFVRAGAAPDVALVTPNARGSDSAITVKATTGLTFDSAAVAGNNAANWEAIWK